MAFRTHDRRPGSCLGITLRSFFGTHPCFFASDLLGQGQINLSLVLSCNNHMNLFGPKFRDHYRSGGPWFPHLHCWGMAALVMGHLLVINDVLAGAGDYVASCGGHDGLDRGHQPREKEGGKIRCVPPFLFLLPQWALCFSGPFLVSFPPSHVLPLLPSAKPRLAAIPQFPPLQAFFIPSL